MREELLWLVPEMRLRKFIRNNNQQYYYGWWAMLITQQQNLIIFHHIIKLHRHFLNGKCITIMAKRTLMVMQYIYTFALSIYESPTFPHINFHFNSFSSFAFLFFLQRLTLQYQSFAPNNLKMSKQGHADLCESGMRRKVAKSTDLKRRLFEVGLAMSPPSSPPLLATIASPKRLLARHPPPFARKQEEQVLLKYQPSHSPQLAKTSKDFQIRKSPKASKSPQQQQSLTLSSFYRPDSIRGDTRDLKTRLLQSVQTMPPLPPPPEELPESKLDQYVSLVLRGVEHIDEFLYLVRGSEENIYELELVDFQVVREHQGESAFEYYTVSKKGFCQYVGGKPHAFLDIGEWAEQKGLYLKIKALKFFYRFRRWKTLQMWRRTITKQRREAIAHSLSQRLFLLQPTTRITLLQLRRLTLQMERSVLIIAKNEGAYTLQSFKHCQQRARRQASLAVEQYSRESRAVVRKCFEGRLSQLRENIKRKAGQEKASVPHSSAQSPKESAFQALGFPSKMTYQHRSRLRKQAGRFLRFSYLVDSLHLSCLAGLYSGQVAAFICRLQQAQLGEAVRLRAGIQQGKDEADRQRMFVLQLICNFREVPQRLVSQSDEKQQWSPVRDIRLKNEERGAKLWVHRLCQHWLSLQPALDEVLDQLGFLLREGLGSLKCFQRWARHRQMQKYVSILEQWDDLVSQNWEISENDNLDPLLLLDSLDPALSKLKMILKTSQNKLLDAIRNTLTDLLNAYWHYSQLPLHKLESQDLINPAQTFEQFLLYTSKLLQRVTNELPHRIQLGVISVQVTRIKTTLGQKFAGILQGLRGKLPQLVEERTAVLNNWLTAFGARLREQILNIDDFVKVVGVIKQVQGQFGQKRQECNQLAQLYQTMQVFRMDTRRRKDFETVTLKLKDQLEQLLITAEQNIERKADLYTREVLKYHLPTLVRDINKSLENVEQPRFLRLDSYRAGILQDLSFLQAREGELIQQRKKCESYMTALKIQGQTIGQLNQLSRQISSRVQLWKTLEEWQGVSKQYQSQISKSLPLSVLMQMVQEYKSTLQRLEQVLPPNEILHFLKQSVKQWHVYLPILNGFSESLSQAHWNQIYEVLPDKYGLDLKKREFTLMQFLKSGIGGYAREIQSIFEKCRVQAQLQRQYQAMQDAWLALVAKIRTQGRFMIISNGQTLQGELDHVLGDLASLLSNPHAQSLKQYSITYDSLFAAQEALDRWLRVQDRIVQVQKQCRLLDIKKLPDYNYFQNAERLYKQASKAMSNKGAESGVKIGKLLVSGVEEKLSEIQSNLTKVEENIKGILREHRRVFPSFYLFTDAQLLHLITEQTHQSLEWAAKRLNPSIGRLQFENERISAIVTIDEDRLIKNPISISSQVEQILFQVGETTSQLNRRALRSCRYKAVENNLSGLVDQYNIQHLLAISRVDFSHYTTISIDNQQDTPDSLAQFRKVMRKDTAEDIKTRQHKISQAENNSNNAEDLLATSTPLKKGYLEKYDTLLLQQLLYEQILDYLIKTNIKRGQQFPWASQLKFFWQDTPSDQPNITVRQLHLSLKYGSDFIGSKTKVILQNQVEALLGIRYGDCAVYNGNRYNLQRLANAVGYKVCSMTCTQLTTQHNLKRFLIGCYFADYIPFLNRADQLTTIMLDQLPIQRWVQDFKANNLKRNSPYLKEVQKNHAVFLNVRDSITGWQALQGKMRIVHYLPPKKQLLRCTMRLRGMYSEERTSLLLRIFEAVGFLEEKSRMQGVSLEEFLDILLQESEEIDEHRLFQRVLGYLKPKITLQTHNALTKHVQSLALLPFDQKDIYQIKSNKTENMENIIQCLNERKVIILTGKGYSKKYFIKKEAEKLKVKFVQIFGENLEKTQLFGYDSQNEGIKQLTIFQKYTKTQQQKILYFQGITPSLLLSLQNLIFSNNKDISSALSQSKTKIILDIPSQQKFITPRQLASFPILHFESSREFINSVTGQWLSKIKEQQKRKALGRIIFQTIYTTLQNLTVKDQIILQEKVVNFLNYLTALHPFKNLLQASLYALIAMYKGSQDEQLKLEYLVKKHLGQEKLAQGTKIIHLFYRQSSLQEKLITQKEYLKIWLEENQNFHDQTYILTPSLLHQLVTSRRIHENTDHSVMLEGAPSSGKTTLFNMYRKLHHQNSFYMHISPAQGSQWTQKLSSSLQRHGLTTLGARINYQQSIIMIQDLHMAEKKSLQPLQLMLFYSRCRYHKKGYDLKNVKFLLSAQKCPQSLQKKCLKIYTDLSKQAIQSIFIQLFKKNIDKQWDINELLIQKIAISSIDTCKKIIGYNGGEQRVAFSALRRILGGFSKLKIKEGLTIQKQVEKFWSFALLQSLKSYDKFGDLEGQLKKLDLFSYNSTILSYTHLSFKPTQKRIQFLKDPKRLYNLLNEKIQKYNQSDTKRYGDSFEFLNFDSILEKMVTISHSILLDCDHILVGRRGTGKQSLVKLCAFFNGLFYRNIKGNIKNTILQLIDGTPSVPHLLYKSISSDQQRKDLHQFSYCDFQSEILSHSDSKPKLGNRQKQKTVHLKSIHKGMVNTDNYTIPKAKLTSQEVVSYRRSFRLVASLNNAELLKEISPQIRSKFHVDFIQEVVPASIMQYNEKLLNVDGITCSKDAQTLLTKIFQYSRQNLGLSLRSNDDCVRLFSSFLANLVNEMVLEQQRYSKVLDLLQKLRNCYNIINEQVSRLHSKLKQLSLNSENTREIKLQIQSQLRQKSTAQSISQKLTQILGWLQPLYTTRLSSIKSNLDNRQNLQIIFAVTASYFIYLSNISYEKRRKYFEKWYKDIPIISKMKPIQSFLSLFLLYEEQFNAEPVDHLPEFYQNMSIIFHSAKPIAIKDYSARGRAWLEKNCTFLYLREDQKDFIELIKDYLSKPSNILIQVIQQQSLNKISQSLIGTLLFLPESVNSINLKGQQIQIHQQSKVYLLIKQGLIIPKQIQQQFTVVLFQQSQLLARTSITHQFYSHTQRQHHITKLDYHRKIRSLRLDCQNGIGQVAQSIYEQLCGNDLPPDEKVLIDRLHKITDKLMVRAQNQFTKNREKQELMHDFQEKYQKSNSKIFAIPAQEFYQISQKIRNVLDVMAKIDAKMGVFYYSPSYADFFNTIKILLSKGMITTIPSLILASLRHWGPLYKPQHYTIFAYLLLMVSKGKQIQDFMHLLNQNGIRSQQFLKLIGRQGCVMQHQEDLEEIISSTLIDLFKEEEFRSIGPLLSSKQVMEVPLIWLAEQTQPNSHEIVKIINIRSQLQHAQIKQKILSNHPKLLQPTEDDSLESLLKKTPHDDVQIIVFSKEALKEVEKVVRTWSLTQKSIIFLHDSKNMPVVKNNKQLWWQIELQNEQAIFTKVIEFYYKSIKIQSQQQKQQPNNNSVISNNNNNNVASPSATIEPPLLNFTSLAHTTSPHIDSNQPPQEYSNDSHLHLLQKYTDCIIWKYESMSLPLPIFKKKQLISARKNIDNHQNPLNLTQKIIVMLQSIHALLHPPSNQITLYAKGLQSKLIKLCSETFSEEDFFKEAEIILSEGNEYTRSKNDIQKQTLRLELGWLVKTRRFFCMENEVLLGKYIRQIQDCITSCLIYNEAPKVTRGSKRQVNIKRRQSQKKPIGRQSQSLGKRILMNKSPLIRTISSPLASLYLLKESEYFEQILYKIHKDLQHAKFELQNIQTTKISDKTLSILIKILSNQPIPSWKSMLSQINCANTTLNLSIRSIISRRNQIYTYYNKFSISQSCELQFKYIRHPAEFLRAYFRSELNSQDSFMLATALTAEQAQRGEYLRVNGMWGIGWRLTPQGVIQNMGESKPIQVSGCFIIKKTMIGVAVNPIDLIASPESNEPLMKLFAMSKKSQGGTSIKLYLKYQ